MRNLIVNLFFCMRVEAERPSWAARPSLLLNIRVPGHKVTFLNKLRSYFFPETLSQLHSYKRHYHNFQKHINQNIYACEESNVLVPSLSMNLNVKHKWIYINPNAAQGCYQSAVFPKSFIERCQWVQGYWRVRIS